MNKEPELLAYELSRPGRIGTVLPQSDVPETPLPASLLRNELPLPEMDELTVVRHFTRLSQKNFSIDTQYYPLGSCTMKYNPKANEAAAAMHGWKHAHPLIGDVYSQGSLELMYNLQEMLAKIGGFTGVSLQPAAGAHGELAGVLMIRAYHTARGDTKRTKMLIPDSAHGTNPATSTMAGMTVETIPSDADGDVDIEALKKACDETVAGIMITNPNTLGLFEKRIREIVEIVHRAGGLVYGDGANLNAITGILRPADVGIDVMHFNLHKTFSTPHGGGGPGVGMVGAGVTLAPYLPGPIVVKKDNHYALEMPSKSIGRLKAFYGNFAVLVRAYTYVRMVGEEGLRRIAENAVLNANYVKAKLEQVYPVPYKRSCMHEFVARGDFVEGIHTLDIAKRLIDYDIHPPTIYFPLIVPEAIMIEPTETESKETLDRFIEVMLTIAQEAKTSPDLLHDAPHDTPVSRLDEVAAARNPVLCYRG
ncbi:MAG TPA: aminomethyl-transferring glycine dehydrogenase subunit GcvPB [Spirochaetia bacterium]|nr:aminomethyl-transferring glycine dehydrogenase subunit GcvPB [Spirochaetales bacterium]HPD79715.1 aminomethyl-transferring glycine dehydrogenase subunit GcvPB [Spirochaetales bacterium]HQK34122.1 aminomethyl-transferring glycine dehydrogenase subunit GcvPB [Spirochaetales bacterium]HRS64607.1 aminomethyl-transferring glycine dehydrogenase subunit GcvPB [Spirochaetia bacterium]HRV29553.1 aminomethyl-transferring glycine dehydrogenase subunit GcvPB [Spirochaetia bacterium]